jgi:glycosyltransferase involved in cell wall biosynthesis
MKVALLSHDFAEYCIQLANGLSRECEVMLVLPRAEAEPHRGLLDPAVKFCPFDKPRLRQPLRQLASVSGIVRTVRRFAPDVIHRQHGHLWFNLALPWLRSFPTVTTIHDPRHHVGDRESKLTPQRLMDYGYRTADRVIVHGDILKQRVVQDVGLPGERVHVIPHIALGRLDAPPPCETDGQTVLFFGRIWKYKGLEYLIRAEPQIAAEFPNARIVIAGEGDDFEPYRQLMGDSPRFVVHNRYISTAERDELFRQASVVVLPYIEATQSGVVPLASAFAKPVVATRVGALGEAVEDGRTGLLVPPENPAALAAAVNQLLGNAQLRNEMGLAGWTKLEREGAPSTVATQTVDVYRRAVADRRGSKAEVAQRRPAEEFVPGVPQRIR